MKDTLCIHVNKPLLILIYGLPLCLMDTSHIHVYIKGFINFWPTSVFAGPGYTLVVFLHTPRHRPLVEDKLVQVQQFVVYIKISDAAFVVTILYLEIRLQIGETSNL